MDSDRLAQEVAAIITHATDRITGVGRVQYEYTTRDDQENESQVQRFEIDDFLEIQKGILEEIEDTINHLCMLHIRVRRLGEKADRLAASI